VSVAWTTDAAEKLSELWFDEGCSWGLTFDQNPYPPKSPFPWCLTLEWATEHDTPHNADFCTYTWQFYGASAEECVNDALKWATGLLPFKRCASCDGDGAYGAKVKCIDCGGSGLASGGAA
jgi:hypothetical protein